MYAYDFEYDGKLLSDFGFIVGSLDNGGGLEDGNSGSEISFETASTRAGKRWYAVGSKYNACLSAEFTICKDPKIFPEEEMEITADEFRALSRWLNRREYLWFHAFDWCEPEKEKAWFRASFGLSRMDFGGATYGINLHMETDAPFGYGEEIEETLAFTAGALTQKLADWNDEIGECYPVMDITCGEAGTLTLSDDITGCVCTVENCTAGEVISLSGDSMIISSSSDSHDIANDFNYEFFCFGNTIDERENQITASMPCTVSLRYRPIRKDTI